MGDSRGLERVQYLSHCHHKKNDCSFACTMAVPIHPRARQLRRRTRVRWQLAVRVGRGDR